MRIDSHIKYLVFSSDNAVGGDQRTMHGLDIQPFEQNPWLGSVPITGCNGDKSGLGQYPKPGHNSRINIAPWHGHPFFFDDLHCTLHAKIAAIT